VLYLQEKSLCSVGLQGIYEVGAFFAGGSGEMFASKSFGTLWGVILKLLTRQVIMDRGGWGLFLTFSFM
jgi:hypothetical protein